MKKTFLGLTLVATTLLTVTVSTQTAEAALSEETDVGIGFSQDGEGTGPYKNNLNIVKYPKSFDFGQANEAAAGQIFNAKPMKNSEGTARAKYLAVFDDRSDKETESNGWKLTAQLTDLENKADSTKQDKLNGKMTMTFTNPKDYLIKDMNQENTDYIIPDPSLPESSKPLDDTKKAQYDFSKIENNAKIELPIGGSSVDIMGAKDGEVDKKAVRGGVLTDVENIQLHVSNKASDDAKYSGKVKWALSTAYQAV